MEVETVAAVEVETTPEHLITPEAEARWQEKMDFLQSIHEEIQAQGPHTWEDVN